MRGIGFPRQGAASASEGEAPRSWLPDGTVQLLAVPTHAELDTGTCRAILRQATRFIPETDLRPHFYSD